MIARWISRTKPFPLTQALPKVKITRSSFSFAEEIRASSYYALAEVKRAEFVPHGLTESLESPPPFSRSLAVLLLAASAASALVTLWSPSPMIVSRSTRYHLRIAALGLLYFTGEDLAAAITARAQPWGHRHLPTSIAIACAAGQSAALAGILSYDSIGDPKPLAYFYIWILTCVQTGLTLASRPYWLAIPRSVFYSFSLATLPAVAFRTHVMADKSDELLLSGFLIS